MKHTHLILRLIQLNLWPLILVLDLAVLCCALLVVLSESLKLLGADGWTQRGLEGVGSKRS